MIHMFKETLNDNSIEYFEELLRLLTFCTFYGDVAPMWPTFPLIYTAHELWAPDYIADMIPPIDNFISRGTETFLTGPYLDMAMNMYKKSVGDKDTDEQEAGQATELVESILHNCKGRVDRIIPEVISIASQRLTNSCDSKDFKVLLIEVIANALYYNPALTLQVMEAQGCTQFVFTQWLDIVKLFKREYDIKLVVLGLAAIFELPLASLPPVVQQGAKFILEALVTLLKTSEKLKKDAEDRKLDREHELAIHKKEQEEKKANGKADEEQLEDDEDDDFVQLNDIPDTDDADAIDSDDEEMEMALLNNNVRNILSEDQPIDLGDDSDEEAIVEGDDEEDDEEEDDDEDDDDDDDEEDEEYITVIDKVDELVYFATKMHTKLANEGAHLQGLLQTMTPEKQKHLQELVESAKAREAENAQKEQQRLLKQQQQKK